MNIEHSYTRQCLASCILVPRLYGRTRLSGIVTKSGMMLGLGEREDEVVEVMKDLREVGCDAFTLGQYLRPSTKHHQVLKYISPREFENYKRIAEELGFKAVASGCFVRSSFNALEMYWKVKERRI